MQLKRKILQSIRCDLDRDRFTFFPPGAIVELTDRVVDGKRRVQWSGSKEGMGFVMVDDDELHSRSEPA